MLHHCSFIKILYQCSQQILCDNVDFHAQKDILDVGCQQHAHIVQNQVRLSETMSA
jgi:hypothetical protein